MMSAKEKNRRLFWAWGAGIITFAVALLNPIGILINLGVEGRRWVQNDIAYSFFVPLILPLAVGIFIHSFDSKIAFRLPKPKRIVLLGLFVILQVIAAGLSSKEILRGPVLAPFMLKEPEAAITLDRCLRDCMRAIRTNRQEACAQADCPVVVSQLLVDTGESTAEKGSRIYKEANGRFESYRDFLSRGSVTAYVASFFDVFSGFFVMLVLWYIVVLIVSKRGHVPGTNNAVAAVWGLLIFWFPMHLYSEWYRNFYSITHFRENFAFWFLLALALLTIPLLILLLKPARPVTIFTSLQVVVGALFGFVNYFRPEWVRALAESLEIMSFSYFVAFAMLVFIVLATMVFAMITLREPSTPE